MPIFKKNFQKVGSLWALRFCRHFCGQNLIKLWSNAHCPQNQVKWQPCKFGLLAKQQLRFVIYYSCQSESHHSSRNRTFKLLELEFKQARFRVQYIIIYTYIISRWNSELMIPSCWTGFWNSDDRLPGHGNGPKSYFAILNK